MTLQQSLELAINHFNAGRLAEAEALYRQILAREPNHPQAMHLLGALAHQIGRNDVALQLINRSIALQPNTGEFYVNLGVVLEALERPEDAVAAYQTAVKLRPDLPEAHFNLGSTLVRLKRVPEAEACFHRAIELRPNYAKAHNNLGSAAYERGELGPAGQYYQRAIDLNPGYYEAHNNLGNVYYDLGQIEPAMAHFRLAIQHGPDYADAHNNLGRMLIEMEQLDEGLVCFNRAIALKKDHAQAYTNIANVMFRKGRLEEAAAFGREALRYKDDYPSAHWNLGLILLCKGELAEGWKEYSWRSQVKELGGACREFPRPLWDGGELNGKTILLHAEQGFGDTIQFLRYIPRVKAKGGRIIIDCRKELSRLVHGCFDVEEWQEGQPLPEFEVHCPMLSLPMAFGTTLENIPADVPYLFADAALSQSWNERTRGYQGPKVGIVWAGRPAHRNDRNRSIALTTLLPQLKGTGTFISLQKGPPAAQIQLLDPTLRPIDWTDELNDFADTAALLANLDLVIAVDTAIVHLAGAMNKPVWVLSAFSPDWRWMLHREDSPWYPSLRLFRQPRPGDWQTPIQRMAQALQTWGKNVPPE
jgi:tetratricopeptide (TPR) repeat protein